MKMPLLETDRSVKEIILEQGLLTKEEMDYILSPKEMTRPGIAGQDLVKNPGN